MLTWKLNILTLLNFYYYLVLTVQYDGSILHIRWDTNDGWIEFENNYKSVHSILSDSERSVICFHEEGNQKIFSQKYQLYMVIKYTSIEDLSLSLLIVNKESHYYEFVIKTNIYMYDNNI